eukprot:Nk52_evm17s1763 gene=Nk52_evmTU17s1763
MSDSEIQNTYNAFCKAAGKSTEMTNKAFAKLCKDCKVQDGKKVTSTDVDIVFSKVKAKGSQTITVKEFVQALEELSKKRFPGNADAVGEMKKLVAGKQPGLNGTTGVANAKIVDKMTDTSQYTGAHKARFDADGKGKGLAGRTDPASSDTGYVGNYKGENTYDATH